MEGLPNKNLQTPAMESALQSIWGALFHAPDMEDLVEDAKRLAQRPFATALCHVMGIAQTGDALAMHAALKTLPQDYLQLGWKYQVSSKRAGVRESLLDVAISSGSPPMARLVKDPSTATDKKLPCLGSLNRFKDTDECRRLVSHGRIAHFRAYFAVAKLENQAETMADFLMVACDHDHLEMAHMIWNLGGSEVADHLTDAQKEALVELGGEAAAQGRLDFLELLVVAKAPLDHEPQRTTKSMVVRAAMMGQTQAVKLLAEAGASLIWALQTASYWGQIELMTVLIHEFHQDVNFRWGEAALCCVAGPAVAFNRLEALQLLHARGAELRDDLIILAEERQSKDCLDFLRQLKGI